VKLRPTVLVETTVLSYLVARRSRDPVFAARQVLTRTWWKKRHDFVLFTSSTVREEAAVGDPREAKKRLAIVSTMGLLDLTPEAEELAAKLIKRGALPEKALPDALHLAIAAVTRMEYLASWNYRHLVNGHIQQQVFRIIMECGYNMPDIRTPGGLLEVIT
jgi:hypothetical protein